MAGRQIPWNPSQPAIASQTTSCLVPSAPVKRSTGWSDVRSINLGIGHVEMHGTAGASRCAIRSFTTSVWA